MMSGEETMYLLVALFITIGCTASVAIVTSAVLSVFNRSIALKEADTPAAIEEARQRGLTSQIRIIKEMAMHGEEKVKAIQAIASLHEADAEEIGLRHAAREISLIGKNT